MQDQLPTPADTRQELGLGVPGLPHPVLDHRTLGTEARAALRPTFGCTSQPGCEAPPSLGNW